MQQRPRKSIERDELGDAFATRSNSLENSASPHRATVTDDFSARQRKRIMDSVRRDFGSQLEHGFKRLRDAVYGDPQLH